MVYALQSDGQKSEFVFAVTYQKPVFGGSSQLSYLLKLCCVAILENLTAKVKAWELEKGIPFLYDKVIHELHIGV